MWATILLVLPILANVGSFVVVPEDEILKTYKLARAQLKPEQEEFLLELLAADDALIESASRGIVDDILQAIAGLGQGQIQVNLVGPGNQPQQQQPQPLAPAAVAPQSPQAPAPVAAAQPAPSPSSGQFTLDIAALDLTPSQQATLTAMLEKSLENITSSAEPSTAAPTMTMSQATVTAAPTPGLPVAPTSKQQAPSNVTTIGGNNNHLFNTITSVIMNSNRRNVTGIVDQSLRIATPAPIREFVTGILNVVYCNGIRRLLGRC
ncbi:unnamed protein product [Orchesella dallaii]|uniref:Uncharacterized protein n=1 Tax=Orchesella dallaii TaxID=48710 RepID=A0ABP1RT95_9HEXA